MMGLHKHNSHILIFCCGIGRQINSDAYYHTFHYCLCKRNKHILLGVNVKSVWIMLVVQCLNKLHYQLPPFRDTQCVVLRCRLCTILMHIHHRIMRGTSFALSVDVSSSSTSCGLSDNLKSSLSIFFCVMSSQTSGFLFNTHFPFGDFSFSFMFKTFFGRKRAWFI